MASPLAVSPGNLSFLNEQHLLLEEPELLQILKAPQPIPLTEPH